MKNILLTAGILLSFIFLVSCKSKVGVTIEKEELVGNTYSYVISINNDKIDESNLDSLTNNTVYELYNKHKVDIGNSKVYFSITFKINDNPELVQVYVVNQNLENPGLKKLS